MGKQVFRVFVASPGDVAAERLALAKSILEINQTISIVAPEKGLSLELVGWETHAYPAGGGAQEVINDQLRDYDIFVGIMWQRFGTPTKVAGSGTEEEFRIAYGNWEKHRRPHLMFYFCQAAVSPGGIEEAEQLVKVAKFRKELSEKALVWEYGDHGDFADTVRPHLLKVLAEGLQAAEGHRQTQETPAGDVVFAVQELRRLAKEYDRLRERMGSGDTRTRQMELLVTRMRSVMNIDPRSLHTLARDHASSSGDRLAAIAMLQVRPQAEYIEWLGDECSELQPFVGYHAAIALLTAVRVLGPDSRRSLQAAINNGLDRLRDTKSSTDRYRTLSGALEELAAR